MQWLRLYHDTINDPKWRVVSIRSKQPVGNVLAVWMQMLVCASTATERGTLEGWDDETSAAILGYDPEAVTAIREAMQGRVLDGLRLTGWDKRQFPSDTSAERTRRYRAKNAGGDGGDGGGSSQKANGAYGRHSDGDVTSREQDVTSQMENVTVNVTSPPLRATDLQNRRVEENSIPAVDPIEPSPPLRGGGGLSEFRGRAFNLSASALDDCRKTYHAIPDLMAALRMLDEDLAGRPEKQVYGALRARLHGMHQRAMEARAAKQPKPKPHANRTGIRRLGGRSAA